MKAKKTRYDAVSFDARGAKSWIRWSVTRRQANKMFDKLHRADNLCAAGVTIKRLPRKS